jgi:hypothetical protein
MDPSLWLDWGSPRGFDGAVTSAVYCAAVRAADAPVPAVAGSLWLDGSGLLCASGLAAILVGGKGGEKVVLASAERSGRRCGAPRAMRASAASLTLSVRFKAAGGSLDMVAASGDPGLLLSLLARLEEAKVEAADMVAGEPGGSRGRSRRTLARLLRPTVPVEGEPGADGLEEVRVGWGRGLRTDPTDEMVDCLLKSDAYAACETTGGGTWAPLGAPPGVGLICVAGNVCISGEVMGGMAFVVVGKAMPAC